MTQQILINDLPEVTQKPIIEYSKLQEISAKIKAEVDSFGIDKIEVSEKNLSLLKSTRASLNGRFREFEDRRKFIKGIILKPFDDFEAQYKSCVSAPFSEADALLKKKIQTVESGILEEKIANLKIYFDTQNRFDFVKFEQLGLKITRSASDKSIKETIDSQLNQISSDIETIKTLENKDRVLAQYQMSLDLNTSISSVNIAIEREKQIEARKQAESKPVTTPEPPVLQPKNEAVTATEEVEVIEVSEEIELFTTSFKVTATMQHLKELKEFMDLKGIEYESRAN